MVKGRTSSVTSDSTEIAATSGTVGNSTNANTSVGTAGEGARHIPHYYDQHEDYVPVSRSVLREISTFGWLQEGAGGAGMFFVSGAFWLLVTLVAEHSDEVSKYAPWFILCLVSIIFGGVLIWVGYSHFQLKQAKIEKVFREHGDGAPNS